MPECIKIEIKMCSFTHGTIREMPPPERKSEEHRLESAALTLMADDPAGAGGNLEDSGCLNAYAHAHAASSHLDG